MLAVAFDHLEVVQLPLTNNATLCTGATLQVDSAFHPPWDGKMSISFRAE